MKVFLEFDIVSFSELEKSDIEEADVSQMVTDALAEFAHVRDYKGVAAYMESNYPLTEKDSDGNLRDAEGSIHGYVGEKRERKAAQVALRAKVARALASHPSVKVTETPEELIEGAVREMDKNECTTCGGYSVAHGSKSRLCVACGMIFIPQDVCEICGPSCDGHRAYEGGGN